MRTFKPVFKGCPYRNLMQLARKAGLSYSCVQSRLKYGWTLEAVLSKPKGPRGRKRLPGPRDKWDRLVPQTGE